MLNKDKPGDGDAFEAKWMPARVEKYQPSFEKAIDKSLGDDKIVVIEGSSAKYTIVIKTNDMNLGTGKRLIKVPALVNYTLMIVETADKSKVVAKGTLEEVKGEVNAPKGSSMLGGAGMAMNVTANEENRDYTNRIAKAYEQVGQILGKAVHKAVK